MSILSSILPVSTMLGMVRNEIIKQLKHDVSHYQIVYMNNASCKINFRVWNDANSKLYPFDKSETISDIIESKLKDKLKNGDVIDFGIIDYDNGVVSTKIYYQDIEGNKHLLNVAQ